MKCVDELRLKLAAFGVRVEKDDISLFCEAPTGFVWRSNDLPTLTIHCSNNRQSWTAAAIRSELPNLRMGLRRVDDPNRLAELEHELGEPWRPVAGAPEAILIHV